MENKFTFSATPAQASGSNQPLSLSALATPKPTTNFGFGTPTPANSAGPSGATSFSFNAPSSSNTNKNNTASTSNSGFAFNAGGSGTSASTMSFATKPAATTGSLSSFGNASASTALSFGTAPSVSLSGASTAATAPTTSLNFGSSFAAQQKPSSDTNSAAAPNASSGFTLNSAQSAGNTSSTDKPALSFGATSSSSSAPISNSSEKTPSFSFSAASSVTKPTIDAAVKKEEPKAQFSLSQPKQSADTATKPPVQIPVTDVQTQLRGKSMQDLVSEWTSVFHKNLQEFHSKAAKIAHLDTLLLDQSEKIHNLVIENKELGSRQSVLSRTLDYIESQQSQLDAELDTFEQKLKGLVQTHEASAAMDVREQTFESAQHMTSELDALNSLVNEIMSFINQSSKQDDHTITLISKILNEHFNSLKWIDNASSFLSQRLTQLKTAIPKK